MSVSAVVVSHGHADELATLLPALAPQVDELVVVANLPGSAPATLPADARLIENERPRRLAENVNLGVRATSGEWVLYANPDAVPEPGAVAALVWRSPRDAIGAGSPARASSGPTARGSRRDGAFPTVGGTLVRRTPLRLLFPPLERQRAHYHLDEDVDEPVEADWLLGAFLLMRRAMLDELGGWDEGYRHYVEDIDLCYRAMRAGWERWYVPAARVRHDWAQVSDRQLPLPPHAVARAQHGAVRPPAPRDAGAAVTEHDPKAEQYARKAAGWSDAEYADGDAYLAHRAELVASLGVALEPGDEVLDLACGDGGLGAHLVARGLRYLGVDSEPAMVEAARRRLGGDGHGARSAISNTFTPDEPVAATTVFRAIYYADDRAAFFRRVASFTERKLVFDLNPRQYPLDQVLAELEAAGFARVELRPFFVPQTQRLPRPAVALLRGLERVGPVGAARAPRALHLPRRGCSRLTTLVLNQHKRCPTGARRALAGDDVERDAGAEGAALAAARLGIDLGRARTSPSRPRRATARRVSGSATVREAHAGT